jgi:hypothetical protein
MTNTKTSINEADIILRGQIEHVGWDIPTDFWIFKDGACLRNFAHGGDPDTPTNGDELIEMAREVNDQDTIQAICKALGRKVPSQSWEDDARKARWTPPAPDSATGLRRFVLRRTEDETGLSGTGDVAWGVVFPDGVTVTRWCVTDVRQTCVWKSVEDAEHVHGHGGKTMFFWLDPE